MQEVISRENIQNELAWCRDRFNMVVDTVPALVQNPSTRGTPRALSIIAEDGSVAQQAKVALATWKPLLKRIEQLVQLAETFSNVSLLTSCEWTEASDLF